MTAHQFHDYEFDDDRGRVDVVRAFKFITEQTYFGHDRTLDQFASTLKNSLRLVGVYAADSSMIGFARAVSDGFSFAYIADVYIEPEHRRQGLGVELTRTMVEDSDYPTARWILGTRDAHAMYARFGFGPPSERIMERPRRGANYARSDRRHG